LVQPTRCSTEWVAFPWWDQGRWEKSKLEPVIAKISQETPADMIGGTRPRVSVFLNQFREPGFIP